MYLLEIINVRILLLVCTIFLFLLDNLHAQSVSVTDPLNYQENIQDSIEVMRQNSSTGNSIDTLKQFSETETSTDTHNQPTKTVLLTDTLKQPDKTELSADTLNQHNEAELSTDALNLRNEMELSIDTLKQLNENELSADTLNHLNKANLSIDTLNNKDNAKYSAETVNPLSGVLPSIVQKSVYLVNGDIFVSPGSSVTVEAGTVFLFQEFTGIHVQGVIYVKGEKDAPVVFTTKNDRYNVNSTNVEPAPFDWNGIDIYESAIGSSFSNCKVNYTVYGIRSQTEYLRLENVSFSNNGKSEFSIKGERKLIEIQPYSYEYSATISAPDLSANHDLKKGRADNNLKRSIATGSPGAKKSGKSSVFRYTGATLLLGGGVTCLLFIDQYIDAQRKFNDLSDLDESEKYKYTSDDWTQARDKKNDKAVKAFVAGGIGCLGLTAFLISFTF